MSARKRVGVLISGRGSNLLSLIQTAKAAGYPAEIVLVISNRGGAPGLGYAREAGIESCVIDHKQFGTREDFDAALTRTLRERQAEIVCNAGFMRLHSPAFVREWHGRQLNIHPSLLPSFRGLRPQARALDAGVRISGATVHFVSEEMDAGPIVAQGAVPVLPGDDEEALSERILAMEHRLYPLALRLVASGLAWLDGGRVTFADGAPPPFLFDKQRQAEHRDRE